MKPNDAIKSDSDTLIANADRVRPIKMKKGKRDALKVGDSVRIREKTTDFTKGYEPRFSLQIYTIKEIQGPLYTLNNDKEYKAKDLLMVHKDTERAPAEAPPAVNRVQQARRELQNERFLNREDVQEANVQRERRPQRKQKIVRGGAIFY